MDKKIETEAYEKALDLVEHLQEWMKPKQEPEFWEAAKRLNLMLALADIPNQDRSHIAHDIVIVAKLAQMAAFRDGLCQGRREAAQRIADERKKMR